MKNFTLLVIAVLVAAFATAGCNAWHGAGTDIKNAGRNIENSGK
ncbi:MAG: entericidin [Candidatus Omnitrophica bacterium]|nr:entericidin [Candidatus Omnitrophota bacterium]